MNPMNVISQMMRSGINPKKIMMNMLQQNMGRNPMAQNMFSLMQNENNKGIEEMARNMCKSNGITPEQAIEQAKKYLGM
jgi:hypothetical protein